MLRIPPRSTAVVVALGASALLAGSAVAHATADSDNAVAPGHVTEHRLVLVDHTGPTSFDDIAPDGLSVGDSFTFSETLDARGRKVGVAGGRCTEVAVTMRSTWQQCTITAILADGQFTVAGIARYRTAAVAAPAVEYGIVGGTGAYRGARGQVTVTPIKEGSDRIVVDLVLG